MLERDDLEIILRSHLPLIALRTHEELRAVNLVKAIIPSLDLPLSCWTITDGLEALIGDATFNPSELRLVGDSHANSTSQSTTDPEYALRVIRDAKQAGIILLLDFHPFLNEPTHVRLIKEISQHYDARHQKLVFVSHDIKLPPELERFAASFNLKLPNAAQIGRIVNEEAAIWASRNVGEKLRVDRESVAALLTNLNGLPDTDARRLVRNAIYDDGAISAEDLPTVIAAKRALVDQGGLLSFEFDTANMADVGGFSKLKNWLKKRQTQFEKPDADVDRPRGLMLLGVQGGGKSLAAKAIAGMWHLPLLRLDFGVLYNKFFGETERNLREALLTAQTMAPCVLWCDEIEKGIATGDYDSGTSKRLLGTLLTWMAENDRPVFIVATANDVSALPPELIRKGRLDEIFFIDLPSASVRATIFAIHLSKRQLDPKLFNLDLLANNSDGFTGAEIEQAIVAARYSAGASDTVASTELVLQELTMTKPLSVVRAEDIASLRRWAAGRTVSAG